MAKSTHKKYVRCNAEQKRFIVESLAAYCSPSEVSRAVKERYGLELSPQAIHCYDPTKRAGYRLNDGLYDVFMRAREKHHEQIGNIGIAHRVVRLRWLDDAVNELRDKGAYLQAAKLMVVAAKEVGDCYH